MDDDSCQTKARAVQQIISEDLPAADLKWSLFTAANESFRRETCLKPFPHKFLTDGTKNFKAIASVLDSISFPLNELVKKLSDTLYIKKHPDVVDLLHYVFKHLKEPILKTVPNKQYESILGKVSSEVEASRPQYIFEVSGSAESPSECKWRELSIDRNTFYAYHGSKLENFHSIVHQGLQQHLNVNKVFGDGIYLSSELSVSLPYSPRGLGWSRSILGCMLSCVAMCQLIEDPIGVKCHSETQTNSEVPKKYYIASNNDLVRVRYLLVYVHVPPQIEQVPFPGGGVLMEWYSRNKVLSLLLGYGFMLALIGLSNNQAAEFYYVRMLKKFVSAVKFKQDS